MAAKLAVLLVVANGAPVLLRLFLKRRFNYPIDGGLLLGDGRPLFGKSKTWRGLGIALLSTPMAAMVLGESALFGFTIAIGAMLGDLLSSFSKRRMGLAPSAKKRGLDQLPEALVPCLLLYFLFHIPLLPLLAGAALFAIIDVLISPWLFRMGVRKVPH